MDQMRLMPGMARPLKFATPEEFDLMVDLYVATCEEKKEPMTIPGLALFLGFADKSSLYHYQHRKPFTDSVKRARTLIEEATVKRSTLTIPQSSPIETEGFSSTARRAAEISRRLCGGRLVAMPTAIPSEPLQSRFGKRDGRTVGSVSRSS